MLFVSSSYSLSYSSLIRAVLHPVISDRIGTVMLMLPPPRIPVVSVWDVRFVVTRSHYTTETFWLSIGLNFEDAPKESHESTTENRRFSSRLNRSDSFT